MENHGSKSFPPNIGGINLISFSKLIEIGANSDKVTAIKRSHERHCISLVQRIKNVFYVLLRTAVISDGRNVTETLLRMRVMYI